MNDDFEKQLQRQPWRELPRAWRSEILAAAEGGRAAPSPHATEKGRGLGRAFSDWLWPNQRAWAGLAAAWGVILLLHFTQPGDAVVARNTSGAPFSSLAMLQQQTLMMTQLVGSWDNPDPSPTLPAAPKRRSERRPQQLIG